MRTVNSFIGSPIERLEDLRFLRGRGQYVDDLARPGTLHAAILRSSVAHGRIRAIGVDLSDPACIDTGSAWFWQLPDEEREEAFALEPEPLASAFIRGIERMDCSFTPC